MTLEDQIKALLEAKEENKDGDQEQADRVDDEPAVKIENPMDPNLTSSETDLTPQGEIAAGEAQGQEDAEGDEAKEDESEEDEKEDDKDEKKVEESTLTSIGDLLGDEFSQDFKLQAATIFEAAVKQQVQSFKERLQEEHNATVARLEEEFNEKFAQRSKQLEEETSDKIDGYLGFLAEEWKKDNTIALEAAIKAELTESFVNGLKAVFEQHYIDLPDDKVDLYSQTLTEKADLEQSLAGAVTSLKKLNEELNQMKRANIIEESIKDYASLDAERFKTLVEDFAFEDEETFRKKVGIVKKSFFDTKPQQSTEQLHEELTTTTQIVDEGDSRETIVEDTKMSAYLNALRK
jgi:hypothetical protein